MDKNNNIFNENDTLINDMNTTANTISNTAQSNVYSKIVETNDDDHITNTSIELNNPVVNDTLTTIVEEENNQNNFTNVKQLEVDESNDNLFSSILNEKEENINNFLLYNSHEKKIEYEKNLGHKLSKIHLKMRYAQYKYHDIRNSFTNVGVAIIIISFILTIIEAFKNTMNMEDIENLFLKNSIQLIPLILSCIISFLTALIKFRKYEEKIETMVKANEKSIYTISEMKRIREMLHFSEKEDISNVMDEFHKNIYPKYLECLTDIEKILSDNDYSKYIDNVNNMDILLYKKDLLKTKKCNLLTKYNDNDNTYINNKNVDEIVDDKQFQIDIEKIQQLENLINNIHNDTIKT